MRPTSARTSDRVRLIAGVAAVAAVTVLYAAWLHVANPATVSTTFLLIVLLVAATSRLWVAISTSVVAMLCFNFFFLPPVRTFTIADPQNWVALVSFLAVSLVASHLSAGVRTRTLEAVARRDELARLFDLSRDVLMTTEGGEAVPVLARAIARRFDLACVAVALPHASDWEIVQGGSTVIELDRQQLWTALASAKATVEFDAHTRTYAGHRTTTIGNRTVHLVPLRAGTNAIGLLATAGRPIEVGTLDALAGISAIAIERAQFLEERKAAELTKQNDALKTTLLASLGHDLRTPLTAIRVAASNIKSSRLTAEQRDEQSDLILSESERLTRLFQNILEMARIDAGAVKSEARWTHPAEIIEGAREQVAGTLSDHRLHVHVTSDVMIRVDPLLTANAIARVLENAGQYAPAGLAIDLSAAITDEGVVIDIRDHGQGVPAADLPHLFERFYRGSAALGRASGTGMGLWIARSLLAAQGGRIWAENCPDGGARFTMVIPVATRDRQVVEPVDAR